MLLARRHAVAAILPLILVATTGCHRALGSESRASATLRDAAGRDVGTIRLNGVAGAQVVVEGELRDLPAGQHGIHFHMVGRCDAADAFASAGAHFNPTGRKHGLENADGPHAGDLPNLVVDAAGTTSYRATTSRVTLGGGASSLLDADGSAIVVHAAPDDQRTDPSGNSGARVACGVIGR